jgi:argonaute-like protein implicated in RNA metabolism and viral defense
MFIPTDRYITITEARAEELQDAYGEDIVEEKTVFSFDSSMIEKYGEILSRMIEESEEIADKDKEKIIRASTTYSIAKGTIDNFTKLGSVAELFEMTKPVVSIKNAGVIKG